jgi:hypothetical protein
LLKPVPAAPALELLPEAPPLGLLPPAAPALLLLPAVEVPPADPLPGGALPLAELQDAMQPATDAITAAEMTAKLPVDFDERGCAM